MSEKNETSKQRESFVAYEYKEIIVSRDMKSVYADGYPNFGWQLDDSPSHSIGLSIASLRFRRDRKIRNKAELTRLQRQFDSSIAQIEKLECSKTTGAMITAMTVGIVGTAFLAGATFAFIYGGMILLMILLAIPGFVGWVLPYFLYNKAKAKRETIVAGLIDQQYDIIYDACEKGKELL